MYSETYSLSAKIDIKSQIPYVDIIRKTSNITGQGAELIKLLTQKISDIPIGMLIFIPVDDFYLLQDLQSIGMKFDGYLVVNSALKSEYIENLDLKLWAQDNQIFQHIPLRILCDIKEKLPKVVRIVTKYNGEIYHIPRAGMELYFDFVRMRECYFSKFTKIEGFKSSKNVRKKSPNKDNILDILFDSYWHKKNNNIKFNYSNNISNYSIYVVSNGIDSLKDGVYKTKIDERQLSLINDDINIINLFLQTEIIKYPQKNSLVLFIIICEFKRLSIQYGSNAWRIMHLDTGGLLQQMHTSAHKMKLKLRTINFFEEETLLSLLDVDKQKFIITSGATI